MKIRSINSAFLHVIVFLLVFVPAYLYNVSPIYANQSPPGCTGSGLGINLFGLPSSANVGDIIQFSVEVYNGTGVGPIVCDASDIQASITTPDGVTHPITLTRTTLTNGQSDTYTNVVSYVTQAGDIQPDNTWKATASDTGVIHQNEVNSQGGGNQGVNIDVIDAPVVPEFGLFTASITGLSSLGGYLLFKLRNK